MREQVLVAEWPGSTPDVHAACLDFEHRVLSLRKASVKPDGDVSLDSIEAVPFAKIAGAQESGQSVMLIGSGGKLLLQLHFESLEDSQAWVRDIRRGLDQNAGNGSTNDGGEKSQLLTRSRQLQNRIGELEAVSERRDQQLQKMLQRLEGAMNMLEAVQGMCDQQRQVMDAQRLAICELRVDAGVEERVKAVPLYPAPAAQDAEATPEVSDDGEDRDEEIGDAEAQLRELMEQAGKMQEMMQNLEMLAASQQGGGVLPPMPPPAGSAPAPDSDDGKSAEDLLGKLQDMRQLLAMLGQAPGDDDLE